MNGPFKRRRAPSNPFEDEFMRMEEEMERIFSDLNSITRDEDFAKRRSPLVYGFSMRLNQDGKPEIRKFGDVQQLPVHPQKIKGKDVFEVSREPLVDVIEGKADVSVIAELPGVGKEHIKINASETSVVIDAKLHDRNYHKVIALPCKVFPESAKATYKNGVLEVKFTRKEPKGESKGNVVKIE